MASLFVIQGPDQGRRFELSEPEYSIGRDASNQITLHDTEVSRQHAKVRQYNQTFEWIDLGSSNGSFVNSLRSDLQPLRSGDRIQIGRTLMIFTTTSASGDSASRRDVAVGISDVVDGSRIVHSIPHEEGSQFFLAPDSSVSPWLANARSNLQIMYRTTLTVSHTLDIDELLGRILELIFEWVEADRGCVILLNKDNGELTPKAFRDRHQTTRHAKLQISQTILDYVTKNQQGVLTSDARDDGRWDAAASIVKLGVREAICVPMQGRYGIVGVIYIDTYTSPTNLLKSNQQNRFSEDHLKLMVAIGHQAALAVEDTSYYSAMLQAERLAAIGQTIAGLSHHVKNILQGIRGGSYLIEEGLKNDDREITTKGWRIVERNQERISALVMDMLTFSKERQPDMMLADWNQVVSDVVELMRSRAEELHVTLKLEAPNEMPEMVFDPEGMHRVVTNVITNAIDACADLHEDESGIVNVCTEWDQVNQVLRAKVQDNGPGIAEADQAKIFTAFESSKGNRGTGLGLPVSKKIVEEHGGVIRINSKLGEGATFEIEIPAI
ncbi:MAG: FHA domain-containing protein, partial [Pirellulaceae bacterium]